jgi:predicted NBD/HSP70 family sugar kinase
MIKARRRSYSRKIIRNLYINDSLSCAALTLIIEKSVPVTTQLLNSLVEEGYVQETGYAQSTGGRKPVMYALNPNILYVISVAMDQFETRIAILNLKNEFFSPVEKFELILTNNDEALSLLTNKIEAVIARSGLPKERFAGVGIGMPGFIDVRNGINHSYLSTNGKSIATLISDKLELPVFIDNDSSIIAQGELQFGTARKSKNAMVVNVGWGIGLGLILNGELYRGHNGFAGEFSHMPLFANDKLCSCGKSGCLETEASLAVVVEKAVEGLKGGRVTRMKDLKKDDLEKAWFSITKAANEGDQFAVELISDAGYKIGKGIAILIHLFNPETIILSGRGYTAGKIMIPPMQQAINEYCIPHLSRHITIKISELKYDAALIGAAAFVMDNYGREISATESDGKASKLKVAINNQHHKVSN